MTGHPLGGEVQALKQQLVIIWVMLAISQVVYLLVPAPQVENAGRPPEIFPIVLGAVAIAQGIGIVALLRIRAFNPIQAGSLDPRSKDGVARLFTTLLLAWVLAESIAIYGLVLRFVHFELAYALPFALGAACLLIFARPWSPKLRRASTAAELASSQAPLS